MNKGSSRVHERRRKAAEKAKDIRGKPRRNPKNEGKILQMEVQRYKDKEKSMQNEDSSTISNKRMTIHQGIYAHGCSSGAVSREIGLSRETKARAEANLSRILQLASHAPLDKHSNNLTSTTISPHRSFLPKKCGSPSSSHNDNMSSGKRKVEEPSRLMLSPSGSSNSDAVIGSQSKRQKVSSDCSQTVTTNSPTTRENKTKELYHESKKYKTDAQKKRREKSEASEHERPPRIRRILYEPLAAAVKDTLEEKLNSFGKTRDLFDEVLEKIYKKYEESAKNRMSSPGLGTSDVHVIEKQDDTTEGFTKLGDQSESSVDIQVLDVMRTPSSVDYLKINEDPEISGQHKGEASESSLNVTVCPGTTIISPWTLLKRYEEKLQGDNQPSLSSERALFHNASHQSEPFLGSDCIPDDIKHSVRSKTSVGVRQDTRKHLSNVKEYVTENRMPSLYHSNEPGYSDRIEQVTPPSKSICHSQSKCPKTIMVDALRYLERCEQQYDDQQMTDASRRTNQDYLLNYSVGKDCTPQQFTDNNPQMITKSSLDHSLRIGANHTHGECPARRQECGESILIHCGSTEKASYPVGRSELVIRDVNCNQSKVVHDNHYEKDQMIKVLPFPSGTTIAAESARGHISSHVSPASVCIHPTNYQSLTSSSQSSSQCYLSDPINQPSFPLEQVYDVAVPKYTPQNYQSEPQLHLTDPVFLPSSQADGALQHSIYSKTVQNYQPEIFNGEVFPVSSLKNQPSCNIRPHALLCPSSSLSSHEHHAKYASIPSALRLSDTQHFAVKHSDVKTCQRLNHLDRNISDPNLYGASFLHAEKFHPRVSRAPEELPKESIFIFDAERTLGWPYQSTK